MKTRMVFLFDDEVLEAIGVVHCRNRKNKARRDQVIQFLSALVTERIEALRRELRRRKANPDPYQMQLPGMGASGETVLPMRVWVKVPPGQIPLVHSFNKTITLREWCEMAGVAVERVMVKRDGQHLRSADTPLRDNDFIVMAHKEETETERLDKEHTKEVASS